MIDDPSCITFTIPLPPRGCKPGSRGHWTSRARAVKRYREHAMVAALAASRSARPGWLKAEISYVFKCARKPGLDAYIPKDLDNAIAALKPAQDGFRDAGVFIDDAASMVSIASVEFHRTRKEHQGRSGVTVTIRRLS